MDVRLTSMRSCGEGAGPEETVPAQLGGATALGWGDWPVPCSAPTLSPLHSGSFWDQALGSRLWAKAAALVSVQPASQQAVSPAERRERFVRRKHGQKTRFELPRATALLFPAVPLPPRGRPGRGAGSG